MYLVFGAAMLGWNGVLHAETARVSPPGMASVLAGGSTFFVFAGVLTGPSLFTVAYYGFTGAYSTTFVLMVVGAALGGVLLLFARGAARDHRVAR